MKTTTRRQPHPEPGPGRCQPGRTPSIGQTGRAIIRTLRRWRDPKRAAGAQQYFKHAIVALGIPTPVLRDFARRQAQAVKPVWHLAEAVALCDQLLREPELEIRGVGILLLGAFRGEFTPRLSAPAEDWLKMRLDNWALVDSFCSLVLSPLLDQHPAVEKTLRRWSADRCLWVRRASLVALIPSARRGQRLELAYELARRRLADPEDLMHKAIGWLLREAGKTNPGRLREFLLHEGPALPRTTVRYAIERFPAAERARLLTRTRPALRVPSAP